MDWDNGLNWGKRNYTAPEGNIQVRNWRLQVTWMFTRLLPDPSCRVQTADFVGIDASTWSSTSLSAESITKWITNTSDPLKALTIWSIVSSKLPWYLPLTSRWSNFLCQLLENTKSAPHWFPKFPSIILHHHIFHAHQIPKTSSESSHSLLLRKYRYNIIEHRFVRLSGTLETSQISCFACAKERDTALQLAARKKEREG